MLLRTSICLFFPIAPAAHAASYTFTGLGELPGGSSDNQAWGVSADGTVVVGQGHSTVAGGNSQAFRRTGGGGTVGLGMLSAGSPQSTAYGVSTDGAVVVGTGYPTNDNSAPGSEAFRWTSGGGMIGLGFLPGGGNLGSATGSEGLGVSADGTDIVGYSTSASGSQAFRWTSGTGMVGLGYLSAASSVSVAFGASGDGSVVVGYGFSASGQEAFRWTSGGGMVGLGDLPGGIFSSVAFAVSADASVVVGSSNTASGSEPFRWTSGGGMVGIGDLPGRIYGGAAAVSADGSVVVGSSNSASGQGAFRWTSGGGVFSVKDLLVANAVTNLTGWKLTAATGVSADGQTIVGYGVDPFGNGEGWIATVPEPSSLVLAALGVVGLLLVARRRF